MAIEAVAATGVTAPTVSVDADVLRSVTLEQMIGTRMSSELAGALGGATAAIGALGLMQAPMISMGVVVHRRTCPTCCATTAMAASHVSC